MDLLVIYLAAGAPFAVYEITRNSERPGSGWSAAVKGLFWPAFAALWMVGLLASPPPNASISERLEDLRSEMESIVTKSGRCVSHQEVRDVFDAYAGLALARDNSGGCTGIGELLQRVGHENSRLAAVCLARREHKRLELHLDGARVLFADTFGSTVPPDRVTTLADLVEDPQLLLLLSLSEVANLSPPEHQGSYAATFGS